jgi:cyclophilin family peptidyl-prolyl cis-trans isomerase
MAAALRLAGTALLSLALARTASAQTLTRADSALVGRILLAEDRRDAADPALAAGAAHADARIQVLARRALGRTRDPLFVARDSLPRLAPPPIWVEPVWRVRYRTIAALRDDCSALRLAAADSAWPVRFRAAAVARESCASDTELVQTFVRWISERPRDTSRRARGDVAWQGAAHGLLALARIAPREARWEIERFLADENWHLRQYAARAAAILQDTVRLRILAGDRHDNVAEVAIQSLAALTGHADDSLYLKAIDRRGAQVVRAAAEALKGSPRADVAPAALRAFERFVVRANASERDAREALLAAAGRPASEDRPPPVTATLPRDAVALALGKVVRLRVTMDSRSGGGSFTVRLRGDVAPMMAARILQLARDGYYDGLTWHRVEHDFVIQGGSPGANEYVGLPQFLRDELGTVTHARGTLGMSTRGHDTGDAQWFVNLRDNARLDRDYTVWAEVVAGIEIVDGVLEGDIIRRIRPVR